MKKAGKQGNLGNWRLNGLVKIFLPRDLQDILSEINNEDDDGEDKDENGTEMRTSDEEFSCSDIDSSDTDEEH